MTTMLEVNQLTRRYGARVAVEAAVPMSWWPYVGLDGAVVGLNHFGASAPYKTIYKEFGLTPEKVAEAARGVLKG